MKMQKQRITRHEMLGACESSQAPPPWLALGTTIGGRVSGSHRADYRGRGGGLKSSSRGPARWLLCLTRRDEEGV